MRSSPAGGNLAFHQLFQSELSDISDSRLRHFGVSLSIMLSSFDKIFKQHFGQPLRHFGVSLNRDCFARAAGLTRRTTVRLRHFGVSLSTDCFAHAADITRRTTVRLRHSGVSLSITVFEIRVLRAILDSHSDTLDTRPAQRRNLGVLRRLGVLGYIALPFFPVLPVFPETPIHRTHRTHRTHRPHCLSPASGIVPEEGCKGEPGTVRVSPANRKLVSRQLATGGSPGVIQRRTRWSPERRNPPAPAASITNRATARRHAMIMRHALDPLLNSVSAQTRASMRSGLDWFISGL